MKTRKQFNSEFPHLTPNQQQAAYHYLEIVRDSRKDSEEYRQLVARSLDSDGNLLCLRLEMPLEGSQMPCTGFSH